MILSPPCSPLFPYTTLFRSWWTRPRRFLPWISGCALATVTIVAVLYLYFGADLFLPNVFIGRVYSLHEVLSNLTILNSLAVPLRSEEHTSELQSLRHLVCRL